MYNIMMADIANETCRC